MTIEIPQAPQGLQQLWPAFVEAALQTSRLGFGFLVHGEPVSLEKQVLTIRFPAEEAGHLEIADTKALQVKLAELGHPNTQIRFVVTEAQPLPVASVAPAAAAAPTPEPKKEKPVPQKLNAEDFKNDPLIQKALEIFKGHIVEVRAGIWQIDEAGCENAAANGKGAVRTGPTHSRGQQRRRGSEGGGEMRRHAGVH
jgi:hypothetical protein